MKTPPRPSASVAAFLAELSQRDETLAAWARRKKLSINVVYQVAAGRAVGARGNARQVLKAMGVVPPTMHPQADMREAA